MKVEADEKRGEIVKSDVSRRRKLRRTWSFREKRRDRESHRV